jgi:hypothetical protein
MSSGPVVVYFRVGFVNDVVSAAECNVKREDGFE